MIVGVIGFLNIGKFDIREKYWKGGQGQEITLRGLPAFYGEWIESSWSKITDSQDAIGEQESEGQSLFHRVNNLQNLLFVTRALDDYQIPTLEGLGYAQLPTIFVPRALWPEKPRTHEGQVMLNLHFRRQRDVRATEGTYIAWGLLPEAIGNFGLWGGPVFLGIVLGFACGTIEKWSVRKNLFSIEGISACILLIYAAISFEMSAGVLIAMLFQTFVVVVAGGHFIRWVMRA